MRNLRSCPDVQACMAGNTERPHDVARAPEVMWFASEYWVTFKVGGRQE